MQRTIRLQITGMTCAACASRIERALKKMPGIQEANVNLPFSQVVVETDASIADVKAILNKIEQIGYGAKEELTEGLTTAKREIREYRSRFLLSLIFSFPLLWSVAAHFPIGSSLPVPALFASPWFQWALATGLQGYVAFPFYRGAYHALRQKSFNMDTLVALSTSVSYLYSHYTLFHQPVSHSGHHPALYFDTIAMVLTAVLFGKWLEAIAKGKAMNASVHWQTLQPRMARVIRSGEEWIPVEQLKPGDTLAVRPDELVPADGSMIGGEAEADEAILTGEWRPAVKKEGSLVFGGTRIVSGSALVRVGAVGADSRIGRIAALVEQAQRSKPLIQRKVDRVAAWFVPAILVYAAIVFLYWNGFGAGHAGESEAALQNALAVLLVSCPCALGLASPIAVLIASSASASREVLFKEGQSFEVLARTDYVLLDKTGTLTEGRPHVQAVVTADQTISYALRLAAALEKNSAHPIARSIVSEAARRQLLPPDADAVAEVPGKGVEGVVEGKRVVMGNRNWLSAKGVKPTTDPQSLRALEALDREGKTIVHLGCDGNWIAAIVMDDRLKSTSAAAVQKLKRYGVVEMATGDARTSALAAAAAVGIDRVQSTMLPEQKAERVRELQAQGHVVTMIGDGVNDAAALAVADIGIVMAAGAMPANEAGGIVLAYGQLDGAAEAIEISRATVRNIRQNLGISLLYNIAVLPLAGAGLLDPRAACLLMALSSVFVVCNALRLTRLFAQRRHEPLAADA